MGEETRREGTNSSARILSNSSSFLADSPEVLLSPSRHPALDSLWQLQRLHHLPRGSHSVPGPVLEEAVVPVSFILRQRRTRPTSRSPSTAARPLRPPLGALLLPTLRTACRPCCFAFVAEAVAISSQSPIVSSLSTAARDIEPQSSHRPPALESLVVPLRHDYPAPPPSRFSRAPATDKAQLKTQPTCSVTVVHCCISAWDLDLAVSTAIPSGACAHHFVRRILLLLRPPRALSLSTSTPLRWHCRPVKTPTLSNPRRL